MGGRGLASGLDLMPEGQGTSRSSPSRLPVSELKNPKNPDGFLPWGQLIPPTPTLPLARTPQQCGAKGLKRALDVFRAWSHGHGFPQGLPSS